MLDDRLLPLLGYDLRLAANLTPAQLAQLRSVVTGWLCALFLVAWPLGYVFWLTEHSTLLATLGPIGAYLLCLNLLRVAVAGGGTGAAFSRKQVAEWQPGLVPSVFLCVLACLVAQPAHLLFTHHDHAALVASHRAELSALHGLVASVPDATSVDAFASSLANCEFAVFRLQLLWANPTSAARFTALYGILVLVPVFWTRYVALGALRAYEALRYAQVLQRKHLATETIRRDIHAALAHWPSYAPAGATSVADSGSSALGIDVSAALAAPRRARRSQLILKWRDWS